MPKLPRLAGRSCEGCAYAAGNLDGACRLLRRRVTPPCPAFGGAFLWRGRPVTIFFGARPPKLFRFWRTRLRPGTGSSLCQRRCCVVERVLQVVDVHVRPGLTGVCIQAQRSAAPGGPLERGGVCSTHPRERTE